MIQIKPNLEHASACPYCAARMQQQELLWQGIHVCVEMVCRRCAKSIVEDLPVGHAVYAPYRVDVKNNQLFGDTASGLWFGAPLLASLRQPQRNAVGLQVERFKEARKVVIVNCIDFLYGHALLKLLNAQRHLDAVSGPAVVVIVQRLLRWLVPRDVAEVWTVDLGLDQARHYYEDLDARIKNECQRFDTVYLSRAFSHPGDFDITRFTGVQSHDFSNPDFRITFIWREDRCWIDGWIPWALWRLGLKRLVLKWQNYKLRRLFRRLRRALPQAGFTVAGLGLSTRFPPWIDDRRVERFDAAKERATCELYAASRLVIGVHGSNMLLPSAHAGLTIDLMPVDKWSNFVQDVLYQENDPRLAAYRYRYVPIGVSPALLARIAAAQVQGCAYFRLQMTAAVPAARHGGTAAAGKI